MSVIEAGVT